MSDQLSASSPDSIPSGVSTQHTTRLHPHLPPPPPLDRRPPSKGRSTQNPHKFKLGRKGKEKGHKRQGSLPLGNGVELLDDDEDWEITGPSAFTGLAVNGNGLHSSTAPSSRRQSRDSFQPQLSDSQLTEVPREKEKEKKGRGRGLAKKTSQLFSRSAKVHSVDKDRNGSVSPENSTLSLPSASRQMSYSSADTSTSASSRSTHQPFPPIVHRTSSSSKSTQHSRRLSQDSTTSWSATQRSLGSRSNSTTASSPPTDLHNYPIPLRQQSNLSASVPTLSRNALPQPAPNQDAMPSRVSSWFSHLLPTTALPPPSENPSSPARKPPSAAASFLNAARQRAVDGVRHMFDSEAQPDKCTDTMWLMGVPHPGWRPTTPSSPVGELPDLVDGSRRGSNSSDRPDRPSPPSKEGTLRPATWKKKETATSPPAKGFGNLFSTSSLSLVLPATITAGSPVKESPEARVGMESPNKSKKPRNEKEILKWPDQFYDDFRSTVWCTYRSQYAPIVSLPPSMLIPSPSAYYSAFGSPADLNATTSPLSQPAAAPAAANSSQQAYRPSTSPWSWTRSGEERGLTSDAGWGCMLRTGQSMLANALLHLHLGRDWRLPPTSPNVSPMTDREHAQLEAYATYAKILSWFMDDPSPLCPFSVHRMALIGKELGKEVGEWFGPSTAAGALKTLGNSFPPCGLAVATATDSMIYKSDVYAASRMSSDGWDQDEVRLKKQRSDGKWGNKAVLVLVGIRLGLDGVNPIYYDSIKALFAFPQSVGIAGGRPSSSYYFVASQGNSLFYLDPHLTRPAIPLEIPPAPAPTADTADEAKAVIIDSTAAGVPYTLDVVDVDNMSEDSDSEARTHRRQASRSSPAGKRLSAKKPLRPDSLATPPNRPVDLPPIPSDPFTVDDTPRSSPRSIPSVDPQLVWYASAYPEAALRTFHCDKVKKIALSGLDPSMLLGFLCKSQDDFEDFCERVNQLPQKIFSVQEEPPSWDDDDEAGLESVSEPDMDDLEASEGEGGDVSAITLDTIGTAVPLKNDIEDDWVGGSLPKNEGLRAVPLRPQVKPLPGGGGTESWVRPEKEGEAKNGGSIR